MTMFYQFVCDFLGKYTPNVDENGLTLTGLASIDFTYLFGGVVMLIVFLLLITIITKPIAWLLKW